MKCKVGRHLAAFRLKAIKSLLVLLCAHGLNHSISCSDWQFVKAAFLLAWTPKVFPIMVCYKCLYVLVEDCSVWKQPQCNFAIKSCSILYFLPITQVYTDYLSAFALLTLISSRTLQIFFFSLKMMHRSSNVLYTTLQTASYYNNFTALTQMHCTSRVFSNTASWTPSFLAIFAFCTNWDLNGEYAAWEWISV